MNGKAYSTTLTAREVLYFLATEISSALLSLYLLLEKHAGKQAVLTKGVRRRSAGNMGKREQQTCQSLRRSSLAHQRDF